MKAIQILKIGFFANIFIMLFMQIVILIGFLTTNELIESFIFGNVILTIRTLFGYVLFSYWIYLLVLWSKYDKHIGRFFALFFLIGWYSIYYSYWLIKKKKDITNV